MGQIIKFFPLAILCIVPFEGFANWQAYVKSDAMTDEKYGTVNSFLDGESSYGNALHGVNVQCRDSDLSKLEIHFWSSKNWTDTVKALQLRFDKDEMFRVQTISSVNGSGIFVKDLADVTKLLELMETKNFMLARIEGRDGSLSSVSRYSLSGFKSSLKEACMWWYEKNSKVDAMFKDIRPRLSHSMKTWGPKYIRLSKEILKSINAYSGPVDIKLSREYILSVDSVINNFVAKCKENKISIDACSTYRVYRDLGLEADYFPSAKEVFLMITPFSMLPELERLKESE